MRKRFDSVETAVEFSLRLFGLLRRDGVRLGTLQTVACVEAIALLRAVRHEELLRVCRVTLVNRREDLPTLQRLFAWLLRLYLPTEEDGALDSDRAGAPAAPGVEARRGLGERDATTDAVESTEMAGYSTQEADHRQDFRLVPSQDYPAVMRTLERIARRHASIARRKAKRARRGRLVDLRSSLRTIGRYDGEVVEWRYRNRTPTHTPLVIVADVSGSMELYTVFLLNFMHALHRNRFLKTEVFVFSTHLQRVTDYFRRRRFAQLLDDLAAQVDGWSGGTRIGQAIADLNQAHAPFVSARTLVTIMSDGWDTGEAALLECEMATLSRRARSVIWINPLKGDPDYQPLAVGMATARPYVDEFISGHSIDSLDAYATLLTARI